MSTRIRGAAGLAVLLAVTGMSQAAGAAGATGFSGLVGTELRAQTEDVVGTIAELLLGGKGSIAKVVVSEDSERRLAVKVTYRKLADRQTSAAVLGAGGEIQPGTHSSPVKLRDADCEVEVAVELDNDVPPDAAFETSALRLTVSRQGRPLPDVTRVYRVTKRWQSKVGPENVVVKVTPEPVGVTASLAAQAATLAPVLVTPPARTFIRDRPSAMVPLLEAQPGVTSGLPASEASLGSDAAVVALPLQSTRRILDSVVVAGASGPPAASSPAAELRLRPGDQIRLMKDWVFGVPPEVKDKGGKGPANKPVAWLTSINSVIDLTQARISRLWPDIYEDQNPDSGIYYYMPRAYRLQWNPDEGFGMKMLYLAATGEGQAGQVMMTARLVSGIDTVETDIARELVQRIAARQGRTFAELRPLAIGQAPAISLSDALKSQFSIPADKISVNGISDALGEVSVSWVTDTVTKENIQLSLTSDVGINGTATLTPAGGSLPPQTVEVAIALADPDTLGWFRWKRGENWRNVTPYPLRMKYLCALMVPAGAEAPSIYAWSLGDANVPPQAQVELDASKIPAWLDAQAKRMWFVYSIPGDRDGELYDQKVVAGITGGVSSLGAYNITFKTLTPLQDTGAVEISAQVRSAYFDARLREMQTKPALVLDADRTEYQVGPIYLVNRQPGEEKPGDPLFEYRLTVVMPDGTELTATNWVPVNGLRVLIGSKQVTDAVGPLPGSPAGAGEGAGSESGGGGQ